MFNDLSIAVMGVVVAPGLLILMPLAPFLTKELQPMIEVAAMFSKLHLAIRCADQGTEPGL